MSTTRTTRPASPLPERLPIRAVLGLLLLLCPVTPAHGLQDAAAPEPVTPPVGVALRPGEGLTRVEPGEYLRTPTAPDGAVIVLEGLKGVVLDLEGVDLRGAPRDEPADGDAGVGILVRNCEDVRLRGGELGGFRTCILVETSRGVAIEDTRFERYHGDRLLSTHTALDPGDRLDLWASPESWIAEHGAAIAFLDCEDVRVRGCRGRAGQNGLLLARTKGAELLENDFSFLSGWGAALVDCEGALVAHGRFQGCARGYSHGVFAEDFGAAGVYLRGCRSTRVLDSSMTHSSVGVRLEGGHSNLVVRCDLSHATAAGLLATSETDLGVHENHARGGLYLGLAAIDSQGTVLVGNSVESVQGAALRLLGGADAFVARNVLEDCEVGLELRAEYERRPRATWVEANSFDENDNDLLFVGARATSLRDNVFPTAKRQLKLRDLAAPEGAALEADGLRALIAGVGGWMPSGSIDGGSLASADLEAAPALREEILVLRVEGVLGKAPLRDDGSAGREAIVLGNFFPWDFAGDEERPPSRAGGMLAGSRWDARWFSWRQGPDPRGPEEQQVAWRARAEEPDLQLDVGAWRSPYGDGEVDAQVRKAVGSSHFGLIAKTEVQLESGRYRLTVLSDDGVRVRVDGGPVLQDWTWHPAKRKSIDLRLTAGAHELTLEYFQIDGAAALTLDLVQLPADPRTANAR